MDSRTILFFGAGRVGRPILSRLISAGYDVHVFDRDQAALDDLDGTGTVIVSAETASPLNYRRIILCLPDAPTVEALIAKWASPEAKTKAIIIDLTTLSPSTAKSLAVQCGQFGASYLDAPISGGGRGAISGDLVVMVSGAHAAFIDVGDILKQIGKTVRYFGESGSASLAKAINQYVFLTYNLVFAHGIKLGAELGLDASAVRDVLANGAPAHPLINDRLKAGIDGDPKNRFPIWRCLKDIDCLETPAEFSSDALLLYDVVRSQLEQAVNEGRGDIDILNLDRVTRQNPVAGPVI